MKKIKLVPEKKSDTGLKIAAAFLGGVALGMLIAPFIKGIGNNSGNMTYHYHWRGDDLPEIPGQEDCSENVNCCDDGEEPVVA